MTSIELHEIKSTLYGEVGGAAGQVVATEVVESGRAQHDEAEEMFEGLE